MTTLENVTIPVGAEIVVNEVLSEIIEETEAEKETARALAAQLAEAALEGERGRQIAEIREEINECRSTLAQLPTMLAEQFSQTLATVTAEIRLELEQRIAAASAVVVVPANPAEPDQTLLIPPLSEINPDQIQTPTPEPLPENQPAVPEPKKKRHRFL